MKAISIVKGLFILSAFGLISLLAQSFTYQDDPWVVPEKYKNMKNPMEVDNESVYIGKTLYGKHCKSCHGKYGEGDGSKAEELDTPVGDFTDGSLDEQTDGELYYKTLEGRDDMPGFKKKIEYEEDIWHIVNYLRKLAE